MGCEDHVVHREDAATADWATTLLAASRQRSCAKARRLANFACDSLDEDSEIARRCSYEKGCFFVRKDILESRARFAAEAAVGASMTEAIAATAAEKNSAAEPALREGGDTNGRCAVWQSQASAFTEGGISVRRCAAISGVR